MVRKTMSDTAAWLRSLSRCAGRCCVASQETTGIVNFVMRIDASVLQQDTFKACQTSIYPFEDSEEIPLNLEFFVFPNGVKLKVRGALHQPLDGFRYGTFGSDHSALIFLCRTRLSKKVILRRNLRFTCLF